MQRRQQ